MTERRELSEEQLLTLQKDLREKYGVDMTLDYLRVNLDLLRDQGIDLFKDDRSDEEKEHGVPALKEELAEQEELAKEE